MTDERQADCECGHREADHYWTCGTCNHVAPYTERQVGLRDWQPYIRHKATCLLNAVRDNPPDDESCTCGLREFWLAVVRAALTPKEAERARQIAATAPDTEVGRLIVRLVALAQVPAQEERLDDINARIAALRPWPEGERLIQALERLAAIRVPVPAQEERQVTALSGALSAISDDLGEALRKSEIYRLGLAEAAARANTAEAQRDQAWRNLDTAHDDIAALLRESGLGDYARPVSTHDVMRDELLPWVRRAARALGVQSKEEGAG